MPPLHVLPSIRRGKHSRRQRKHTTHTAKDVAQYAADTSTNHAYLILKLCGLIKMQGEGLKGKQDYQFYEDKHG